SGMGLPGMGGMAGAADDGHQAGRRGQGAGAGAGGMGAGGGRGQGQGQEDTEHETADFLLEHDPEGIFGTDEITAPPVIGG
ncbi:MAG: hypothetical protein ACRDSQ_25590, partial [Actinokineospora sp.]